VIVKFNPKAYANTKIFLEWLKEQFIPVLNDQPTLLALDLFGEHKTPEILDTYLANDIIVSMIPGDCTSLVQPLNVSINRPFKDILRVRLKLTFNTIGTQMIKPHIKALFGCDSSLPFNDHFCTENNLSFLKRSFVWDSRAELLQPNRG